MLHFGEEGISKYGLTDAEIPKYRRPPFFNEVIGWWSHKGKSKKKRKLKDIKQMKKIIHEFGIAMNQKITF